MGTAQHAHASKQAHFNIDTPQEGGQRRGRTEEMLQVNFITQPREGGIALVVFPQEQ